MNTLPVGPEQPDDGPQVDPSVLESQAHQESVDEAPSLNAEVVAECASTGNYIALSGKQRRDLDVDLANVVEVFSGERSLGLYVVGKGQKALLGQHDKCAANLPAEADRNIRIQKLSPEFLRQRIFELPARTGLELDRRHERRQDTIGKRFEDLDAEKYLVLPTSVAILMGAPYADPNRMTIRMIFSGQLRFAEKTLQMAFVPSGQEMGFTSSLQQELSLPQELSQVRFGLQDGVLVIDQVL